MFHHQYIVDQAREEVAATCQPFVPVDQAQFIWHSQDRKCAGLVVSPLATQTDLLSPLSSSSGADTSGWLMSASFNPHTMFGQFLAKRWLNTSEYVSMIAEFAKIDSCDWARMMLQGMAATVGAFYGDDERSPYDEILGIPMVERFKDAILVRLQLSEIDLVTDLGDL